MFLLFFVELGLLAETTEQTNSCAVLRGHITNGGSVSESQAADSGTKKLYKFVNDSLLSEHLSAEKHEVSCSCFLSELSSQFEANYFRQHHRSALPQHHRLSLNAPHSPANNS